MAFASWASSAREAGQIAVGRVQVREEASLDLPACLSPGIHSKLQKMSEITFRALLTEDGADRLDLVRT
jgi:hypothetical protein